MSVKTAPIAASTGSRRTNLFDLEREALKDLITLVESRAAREEAARTAHTTTVSTAERELGRVRKQCQTGRERDLASIAEAHQAKLKEIAERYNAETGAADE